MGTKSKKFLTLLGTAAIATGALTGVYFGFLKGLISRAVYTYSDERYDAEFTIKGSSFKYVLKDRNGVEEYESIFQGIIEEKGDFDLLKMTKYIENDKAFGIQYYNESIDYFSLFNSYAYIDEDFVYSTLFYEDFILGRNGKTLPDDQLIRCTPYKLYAGTEYDIFISKDSSNTTLKDAIYSSLCKVDKYGQLKYIIDSPSSITSIKVGTEDMVTTTAGLFTATVTYGPANKTLDTTILVGMDDQDPASHYIETNFESTEYVSKGTSIASFLTGKNVKLGTESTSTAVTVDMISGLDLTTEGDKFLTLKYNDLESLIRYVVYDPANIKALNFSSLYFKTAFEKGTDLTSSISFNVTRNNGTSVTGLTLSSPGITVTGYDKNTTGAQLFTVTYGDEISEKFMVYVYDENDNPILRTTTSYATLQVQNHEFLNEYKFTCIKADNTTEDVVITEDMVVGLDLDNVKPGRYQVVYESGNYKYIVGYVTVEETPV